MPLLLTVNRPARLVAPWRSPVRVRRHFRRNYAWIEPLSWEIPKHLFPRPENFFPRPERFFGGDTFRDLVLKQGEAVKEFPWEYAIFVSVVLLIIAEIVVKPFDNGNSDVSDSSDEETQRAIARARTEMKPPVPLTEEQEAIRALKRIEFQAEQNRNLLILACLAALALWMAGFLNTPHPFEP